VTADLLRDKVGDLRQIASVRRISLGDGEEHGVRALAFSTGGGLDFWALADHSLDIGPLWWRGRQIAWQAPTGFGHPDRRRSDAAIERGFDLSGFLVTCGLEHIRQPADGHPLHGRLPFTPARLTAHGGDWRSEVPVLFCEGEVTQVHRGGEHFRLKRRIEAPVGGGRLTISDTVENLAEAPQRQASLYHFNIGFPVLRTVRSSSMPAVGCSDHSPCRMRRHRERRQAGLSTSPARRNAPFAHRPTRRLRSPLPGAPTRCPICSSGMTCAPANACWVSNPARVRACRAG
jgi:hypothetical protein